MLKRLTACFLIIFVWGCEPVSKDSSPAPAVDAPGAVTPASAATPTGD